MIALEKGWGSLAPIVEKNGRNMHQVVCACGKKSCRISSKESRSDGGWRSRKSIGETKTGLKVNNLIINMIYDNIMELFDICSCTS